MFWGQLGQSGLLSGLNWNGAAMAAPGATFGTHLPSTRSGGGFVVGNANGVQVPPGAAVVGRQINSGLVLYAAPFPVANFGTTAGSNLFTPAQAAQIDRKLDDGNGITGNVEFYGPSGAVATANCWNTTAPGSYNEAQVNSKDCGMIFEIQG